MLTVGGLLDGLDILVLQLEVHGDGGRLDGDTTVDFILSCICEPYVSGLGAGNDTSLGNERVGEGGLSVVDCDRDEIFFYLSREIIGDSP